MFLNEVPQDEDERSVPERRLEIRCDSGDACSCIIFIFQPFIDAAADRDDTQAPSLVLYKPGTEEVP